MVQGQYAWTLRGPGNPGEGSQHLHTLCGVSGRTGPVTGKRDYENRRDEEKALSLVEEGQEGCQTFSVYAGKSAEQWIIPGLWGLCGLYVEKMWISFSLRKLCGSYAEHFMKL